MGLDACREKKVAVSNASGYSNEAVAELVIGMTLSLMRNLPQVEKRVREGGTKDGLVGCEIKGKTVGIIGLGNIGTRSAELFHAFGANVLAQSRTKHADAPEYVELTFEKGVPVALNGVAMKPARIIAGLNELGGRNGIGLYDVVENRLVGMKSRGVYETPGGTILYRAHEVLETLTLDKQTAHKKRELAITFGELVYDGQWFSPLRKALSAFVTETQQTVTGKVRLKLYKGNIINAGVWSPYSLYSEEIATFDAGGSYQQSDATGFIKLYGLPTRVQAAIAQKNGEEKEC